MRISDWSSDVCSSDLVADEGAHGLHRAAQGPVAHRVAEQVDAAVAALAARGVADEVGGLGDGAPKRRAGYAGAVAVVGNGRQDAGRAGNGCGGPCRIRWSP